jgi:hypothetical protein
MSVSDFHGNPRVPATVSNLDLGKVIEVLARHSCNVSDAAADLGVPASDLRRLMWANPQMQDAAFESVEARLDKAEKNIVEALSSEDSRRRDAASFFVLRNTARARKRGWITTSTSAAEVSVSMTDNVPRVLRFRWKTDADDARDAAEAERPRDEEKQVAGMRWDDLDGGKTIDHGVRPEPSNKE